MDKRKIKSKEHRRAISEAKKGKGFPEKTKKALYEKWHRDRLKRLKVLKKKCKSKDERILKILKLMETMSYSEIGKELGGLSKQRIQQIIAKHCKR